MRDEPDPDVVRRLDFFLRNQLAGTRSLDVAQETCLFLQGVFASIIQDTTGILMWRRGSYFSLRVITRPGGLTMKNFLAEAEASYGEQGYNRIVAAINHPRLAAWLDKNSG